MSITSEISRIQTNIANAYTVAEAKGATMPVTENSDNLATTIESIEGSGGQIEAVNNTGAVITSGDKVWINQENGENKLENYLVYTTNTESVGNVTVSGNIASNFSSSNYLKTIPNFNVSSTDSWEICMCFDITSQTSTSLGTYISSFERYVQGPYIAIDTQGYLNASISDGSSWITGFGGPSYQLNQKYWIKLSYNSGIAKGEYSLDGNNFTEMQPTGTTISGISINKQMWIGYGSSGTNLPGNIYLDGCYIKINDEKIWEGCERQIVAPESAQTGIAAENIASGSTGLVNIGAVIEPTGSITITTNGTHDVADYAKAVVNVTGGGDVITATNNTSSAILEGDKVWIKPSENDYNLINFRSTLYENYTIIGSPTVNTSTGIVSGFSSSSYLTLPQSLNPANSPWEVKLKFTTSNSITGGLFQTITSYSVNGRYGICLLTAEGGLDFAISSNGSSWLFDRATSFTLSTNTTYWVKFGWTGTEYYLEHSTDGINYTRDITENSTTPAYSTSNYTLLGVYSTISKDGLNGTLDLSESYIKVNNLTWWDPREIQISENTLIGYAQENIAINSSGSVKTLLPNE